MINKIYLNTVDNISNKIIQIKERKKKVFCLISGPQGSGKTTLSQNIKKKLQSKKLKVLVLSIDNFYFSKKIRNKLSKKISKLLITRGVPGTHNLKSLKETLKIFKSNKKKRYKLPYFSKGHDDILYSRSISLTFPYDIFILEGWCLGYPGSKKKKLKKPINTLERNFDKNLKWRKYVNTMSKKYEVSIYKYSNFSVFLKIPSMKYVFGWRKKQEQQLAKKLRMNNNELKMFLSFYERITIDLLKNYKKYFDSFVRIDSKHNFGPLKFIR